MPVPAGGVILVLQKMGGLAVFFRSLQLYRTPCVAFLVVVFISFAAFLSILGLGLR